MSDVIFRTRLRDSSLIIIAGDGRPKIYSVMPWTDDQRDGSSNPIESNVVVVSIFI